MGKWPARLSGLSIVLFFAVLTALASREFGEVVVSAVLTRTPLEITVLIMLLLATLPSRNDTATFAYIHLFYLPFVLGPAIVIVALSLKTADPIRLLPVWGNEPEGMVPGALTVAALFQGAFILTILTPHMRQPQKVVRASLWGILIAGGLYLSNVLAAVGVFGPEETKLCFNTA